MVIYLPDTEPRTTGGRNGSACRRIGVSAFRGNGSADRRVGGSAFHAPLPFSASFRGALPVNNATTREVPLRRPADPPIRRYVSPGRRFAMSANKLHFHFRRLFEVLCQVTTQQLEKSPHGDPPKRRPADTFPEDADTPTRRSPIRFSRSPTRRYVSPPAGQCHKYK